MKNLNIRRKRVGGGCCKRYRTTVLDWMEREKLQKSSREIHEMVFECGQ